MSYLDVLRIILIYRTTCPADPFQAQSLPAEFEWLPLLDNLRTDCKELGNEIVNLNTYPFLHKTDKI